MGSVCSQIAYLFRTPLPPEPPYHDGKFYFYDLYEFKLKYSNAVNTKFERVYPCVNYYFDKIGNKDKEMPTKTWPHMTETSRHFRVSFFSLAYHMKMNNILVYSMIGLKRDQCEYLGIEKPNIKL